MMNMKIKVVYVKTKKDDDLEKEVNQTIDGIQVNSKNRIVEIQTIEIENGFLTKIVYSQIEEPIETILNEEVKN